MIVRARPQSYQIQLRDGGKAIVNTYILEDSRCRKSVSEIATIHGTPLCSHLIDTESLLRHIQYKPPGAPLCPYCWQQYGIIEGDDPKLPRHDTVLPQDVSRNVRVSPSLFVDLSDYLLENVRDELLYEIVWLCPDLVVDEFHDIFKLPPNVHLFSQEHVVIARYKTNNVRRIVVVPEMETEKSPRQRRSPKPEESGEEEGEEDEEEEEQRNERAEEERPWRQSAEPVIVRTVEKSIHQLEIEDSKTRQLMEMDDLMETLQTRLHELLQLGPVKREESERRRRVATTKDLISKYEAELTSCRETLSKAEHELKAAWNALGEQRGDNPVLREKVTKLKQVTETHTTRVNNLENRLALRKSELEQLETMKTPVTEEQIEREEEIANLHHRIDKLQKQMEDLEEGREVTEMEIDDTPMEDAPEEYPEKRTTHWKRPRYHQQLIAANSEEEETETEEEEEEGIEEEEEEEIEDDTSTSGGSQPPQEPSNEPTVSDENEDIELIDEDVKVDSPLKHVVYDSWKYMKEAERERLQLEAEDVAHYERRHAAGHDLDVVIENRETWSACGYIMWRLGIHVQSEVDIVMDQLAEIYNIDLYREIPREEDDTNEIYELLIDSIRSIIRDIVARTVLYILLRGSAGEQEVEDGNRYTKEDGTSAYRSKRPVKPKIVASLRAQIPYLSAIPRNVYTGRENEDRGLRTPQEEAAEEFVVVRPEQIIEVKRPREEEEEDDAASYLIDRLKRKEEANKRNALPKYTDRQVSLLKRLTVAILHVALNIVHLPRHQLIMTAYAPAACLQGGKPKMIIRAMLRYIGSILQYTANQLSLTAAQFVTTARSMREAESLIKLGFHLMPGSDGTFESGPQEMLCDRILDTEEPPRFMKPIVISEADIKRYEEDKNKTKEQLAAEKAERKRLREQNRQQRAEEKERRRREREQRQEEKRRASEERKEQREQEREQRKEEKKQKKREEAARKRDEERLRKEQEEAQKTEEQKAADEEERRKKRHEAAEKAAETRKKKKAEEEALKTPEQREQEAKAKEEKKRRKREEERLRKEQEEAQKSAEQKAAEEEDRKKKRQEALRKAAETRKKKKEEEEALKSPEQKEREAKEKEEKKKRKQEEANRRKKEKKEQERKNAEQNK